MLTPKEMAKIRSAKGVVDEEQGVAEGDYPDGSSLPEITIQQWQDAYQKAVNAANQAKTQQEYEGGWEKVGKIEQILAKKGIKASSNLGQSQVQFQPITQESQQGMAEGRAPSVIQTIRDNISVDEISKDREGNLIFRRGFFYTNNGSAEQFAARIDNELTNLNIPHTIVDKGQVWRPFKGGATTKSQSHWWVKVKISQQGMVENAGSIASALPTPKAGAGTLFGGDYSNKANPFKKKTTKKESVIKR